jgi:hypothetical protein
LGAESAGHVRAAPTVTDLPGGRDTGRAALRLRWLLSAHGLLTLASVGYCLVIFARTSQSMAFTFDEVVYASQVARDMPAAEFSAPRARGMPLLLAPVLTFTDSVLAVRVYLTLLAGFLMYLAFRPWLAVSARIGGRYAYIPVVAAGAFATLWTAQLYGTTGYPNLWLALTVVGGVGYFCLAVTRCPAGPGPVVAVAVAFAAASLIRPTDAAAGGLPLLMMSMGFARWRRWWPAAAVAGGLLVGWAAWAIEAHLRYGGFLQRLRDGAETNQGGLVFTLPEHFEALDGPVLLCRPHDLCAGVSPAAAAWWVMLPVLAIVGLMVAARTGWLAVSAVATGSALAIAAPYIFLIDYAAPRFLLPTYALLMIPAAAALLWLTGLGRKETRAMVTAVVALTMVAHVVVQQGLLDDAHAGLVRIADNHVRTTDFLWTEHGVGPPCLLWGDGVVQQSYLLKCHSVLRRGRAPAADDRYIARAHERGDLVVVRLRSDIEVPDFMVDWRRVELPGTGRYVVYIAPPGG